MLHAKERSHLLLQIVDLSEKSLTGRPMFKGQVIDLKTKEPLPAAQINAIYKKGDSTIVNMYVADREANFKFNAPRKNSRIEVICVGYKVFEMVLPDEPKNEIDLGKIRLEADVQKADEAVVKGRIALYQMKGDTTLIFPAAIKTMTGDALIDLLRRHPLFRVDEMGNVFFNGQRIERVDVNGKLLFGEDAVTAVKTLTAADVHLMKTFEETLMQGGYQIAGEVLTPVRSKLRDALKIDEKSGLCILWQRFCTFILITISWVIFRSASLRAGLSMLKRIATDFTPWVLFDGSLYEFGISSHSFIALILCVILMMSVESMQEKGNMREMLAKQHVIVRWGIYLAAITVVVVLGVYGPGYSATQFLYGQF